MKSLPPLTQQHRVKLLRHALGKVHRLHRNGIGWMAAVKTVATEYNGKPLPGGNRLLCSNGTLIRLWYRSRKGLDETALRDRRHRGSNKVSPELIAHLRRVALEAGIPCVEIFRQAGGKEGLGFSYPTLIRYIGKEIQEAARHRKGIMKLCVILETEKKEWDRYVKKTVGGQAGNDQKLGGKRGGWSSDTVRAGNSKKKEVNGVRIGTKSPAGAGRK